MVDYFDDDILYKKTYEHKGGVVSGLAALSLWNLTNSLNYKIELTFPFGHHASGDKEIVEKTVRKDLYEIGLTTTETIFGNTVPVYSPERAIIDIWRDKNIQDEWKYQSLKQYADEKGSLNRVYMLAMNFPGTQKLLNTIDAVINYETA
jgi:hypothetical protein